VAPARHRRSSPRLSTLDRVQPPLPVTPLQFVRTPVREVEPGPATSSGTAVEMSTRPGQLDRRGPTPQTRFKPALSATDTHA